MNDLWVVFEILRVVGAIASIGRLVLELRRMYREYKLTEDDEEN